MLYASRQHLAEYLAYGNEVRHVVARINDRWATRDWTPIILDERDDFTRTVAGLQRYDVLFVNPIKDGLNLVAKEGPVVNRRDGIVLLSREAGAFEELHDSVLALHPFDIEQMAVALDDALAMPLDERAVCADAVREAALSRTPAMWLNDQLRAAVGRL
jgi:trehalose 6-phosphate synthase